MLSTVKKKISKFYTAISTAIVVTLLFILQFVVFEGNIYFWKDASFWLSLLVMVVILVFANEIYWKNGSARAEQNDKYINSAIEYSVRINRIKNHTPCLTDDFYRYVDELNIDLYINDRNKFLEDNDILKEDYYYGHVISMADEAGNIVKKYSTPHCELTYNQLRNLKKTSLNGEEELYYTKKQAKAIIAAVHGKFEYEVISATEILSGIKLDKTKFGTSYNGAKNKRAFAQANLKTALVIAFISALLGADLAKNGWTVTALFTFFYRVLMFAWRAFNSDEAGYLDIVDTKRGVNINRSNITTMYATARNLNQLFSNINEEIQATKTSLMNQEVGNVSYHDK